eukprot:1596314-Ditylum_brightwellii.AAC.1
MAVERFIDAWDRGHVMTLFQCNWCAFRVLTKRHIPDDLDYNSLLICCLQHENLDTSWGRSLSTIYHNCLDLRKQIRLLKLVRVEPQLLPLVPFSMRSIQGLGVIVAMLLKSLEFGKYAIYTQFTSMCKVWSAYYNAYFASTHSLAGSVSLGGLQSKLHL